MKQKTLITSETKKLDNYLREIRDDNTHKNAENSIVFFSDQNDDPEHLKERLRHIKDHLPESRVVGVTMPKSNILLGHKDDTLLAGFSYLALEKSKMDIICYDCEKIEAEEAAKRLRRKIRYIEHIAGILVFSAGLEKDIDRFLATLAMGDRYENMVAGVQAEADTTPFVCCDICEGALLKKGIVVIVLYGRGLHLYYNYDMGWKPIGKEMTVTKTDGKYCVETIDGAPAVSIYKDYLDVAPDEYFTENVREFPFITHRGDREVVRTPSGYDEKDRLMFIAKMNTGDKIRLSYGNPRRLAENTKRYADSMQDFGPQALLMIVCENRVRFLGDQAINDILTYQSFMPDLAWVRGFAALMMDKKGGGVVNAAIITIGMREGAPRADDLSRSVVISDVRKAGATPLDQRLAMFLERTTMELEEMAVAADVANAAKSEFLSQMSHEIRTPINAVLGMNEMILRDCVDEQILKYAERVRTAGLSLLNIISDILDFSKIEAGKLDIVPNEYELTSLVNDVVNLVMHRVDEKGLSLRVTVDPDTPHALFGDEIRIKQIITNLLTNAVKYTEKGSVGFLVNFEKRGVDEIVLHVAVADTGIGIRKENIHKLFNAFDRIDNNRARKIEGTGLGLNITAQLLDLMGSKLDVRSEYGEGSVFSFDLVQKVMDWDIIGDYNEAVKRLSLKRSKKKTQFTAENAKILVVDDAPMNLDVVMGLLKRTLMQVDSATSGKECIEKVAVNDYDLIFLDHRMPEMDGIETLQELKERFPDKIKNVPVISLTANAVAGAREIYLESGFSDYLTKPVMSDELEEMLQRYIPEDMITYIAAEDVEEEEDIPLPEWLSKVNLLDTELGVVYCGGVREYLDALSIFSSSIEMRAKELEDALAVNDISNFTIRVHALKSMTKSIGAMDLSEFAASLEEAGKSGDMESIEAGAGIFIDLYRSLSDQLKDIDTPKAQVTSLGADDDSMHHILIVDDDSDFVSLVSRWLKKEYRVSAIHSGDQALLYLQTEKPDLVLLDCEMPGMSGLEVLAKIRDDEETEGLPVIFLTGTEDRKLVKDAERLRPEGFLLKSSGKQGLMMAVSHFFKEN